VQGAGSRKPLILQRLKVAHATGKLLKAASLLGFAMSRGYFSTTLYTVFVDIWCGFATST
jgi:hypothetical protein